MILCGELFIGLVGVDGGKLSYFVSVVWVWLVYICL